MPSLFADQKQSKLGSKWPESMRKNAIEMLFSWDL